MIIFGTRSAHINSVQSRNTTCPSCEKTGHITFSFFRKHAHIFWIPTFPLNKTGVSQCQHCKNVLEEKQMPERLRREFNEAKKEAKGPLWQFSGLILFATLFIWVGYQSKQDKKSQGEFIEAPQQGDLYKYKIESGSYSTFKIDSVSKDSVYVFLNNYEISKSSRIYKIDKEKNYSKDLYSFSKEELKEMYSKGKITDIDRK